MKIKRPYLKTATILFTLLLLLPAWSGLWAQIIRNHSLTICQDGGVRSFGYNESCQLGLGSSIPDAYYTPQTVPGIENAVSVAVGKSHSLAVLDDGSVLVWGSNSSGSAGQPYPANLTVCDPTEIVIPGCAVAVSAGASYSLTLLADGTVWSWGSD